MLGFEGLLQNPTDLFILMNGGQTLVDLCAVLLDSCAVGLVADNLQLLKDGGELAVGVVNAGENEALVGVTEIVLRSGIG